MPCISSHYQITRQSGEWYTQTPPHRHFFCRTPPVQICRVVLQFSGRQRRKCTQIHTHTHPDAQTDTMKNFPPTQIKSFKSCLTCVNKVQPLLYQFLLHLADISILVGNHSSYTNSSDLPRLSKGLQPASKC